MEIISHRGFWIEPFEKNSINAFERSFHFKFGTETDVRDRDGKLVISHDCPNVDNMLFSTFLGIYNKFELKSTLAINIKSDGLQEKIKRELQYFNIENYFVFDMSIPDTILYLENEIKFLCRFSEYEKENDLWSNSNGIWYDNFKQEDKLNLSLIEGLILDRKKVCIVSSEDRKSVV